jgi:SAM-dependent methyltransferase
MGYVKDAYVADVGCGYFPLGAYALAYTANKVFAIDPYVKGIEGYDSGYDNLKSYGIFHIDPEKVILVPEDVFDFIGRVHVVVSCEVFEHMPDPRKFINHLSNMCDYAFITTPLSIRTKKTSNLSHVAEYSAEDFDGIVGDGFVIEDKKYQMGDLRIVDKAEGTECDSMCINHIVQMVWARSKHARK